MELLLHYAQEDCVQQESKPSEQVSTHRSKHGGGEGDTAGCVHLCRGATQDYHETLSTRQEAYVGGTRWEQSKEPWQWPETMATSSKGEKPQELSHASSEHSVSQDQRSPVGLHASPQTSGESEFLSRL